MSERRNAFRRMAIAFVIGAVAVGLVLGAIAFGMGDGAFTPLEVVLFSIAVGCLVASFAALSTVWTSRATADGIFEGDPDSRRVVTRAVVRGRNESLTETQESRAARFADHLHFVQPVQVAQSMLVIVAVALIQLPNLVTADGDPLFTVLFVFLAVCVVVAVVISVVQYRNVSRYAAAHPVGAASA